MFAEEYTKHNYPLIAHFITNITDKTDEEIQQMHKDWRTNDYKEFDLKNCL